MTVAFLLFNRYTRQPSVYNPFGGYADLVVREMASGQETVIISLNFDNNNSGFSFSPASNQGNYEIIADSDCFIYKFNRDGTNLFRFPWVDGNYCYDDFPAVRRGGDQLIAFSNNVVTPDVGGLYTLSIDGGSRQKVPNTTCLDFAPSWSNDNQFIAFGTIISAACSNSFPSLTQYPYWVSNLIKIKPDGSGRQAVTNFSPNPDCSLPGSNCLTLGSVWTEDNSKVIAAGRINGVEGLFKFSTDGSGTFSQIPLSPGNTPDFVGGIVQPRVEQNVVSIGGGVSENENYQLVSTIGEAVAGITSTGGQYSFESGFWAMPASHGSTLFDYDGDGKSDISIFRPSDGAWYLERSTAGLFGVRFGYSDDRLTPADYDGDGKTDVAVYRPSTGIWYIFDYATATVDYRVFGLAEDLPTPADYDGDGKADISVFRPSTATWYRQNSSDGSFYAIQFGLPEDKPTVGDFDGDGKADIAIFRPSLGDWYQLNSSNGSVSGARFGFGSDVVVPADYDGDGKMDLAVYRPSTGIWYITNSSTGAVSYNIFGLSDDIPAPGDFDGDGKADISIFRPSDGTWYRQNSSNGSFTAFQFGANEDVPTQSAFRY